jgi:flagellar motor switch protein FliG
MDAAIATKTANAPTVTFDTHSIAGQRRAAILLISLGSDMAAQVLKYLPESTVERLTVEMFNTFGVTYDEQKAISEEAYRVASARDADKQGGLTFVRDLLVRAMGQDKGKQFLNRLLEERRQQSFSFLHDADPEPVAGVLRSEHPQAIALVLSHLRPLQAAQILSKMEPELQADVSARIATIERIAPEVVSEVETNLQKRLANALLREDSSEQWGGVGFLVQILLQERSMEKSVLEALAQRNPELADEVRNQLFVFEDILKLDDRTVQRILRDVDQKDLLLAIRGTKPEVRQHITKNLSKRAAEMLEEELAIMKPARLSSVEAAQQRVVSVIRRLEESEEIIITRSGGQGDVLI